MKKIFLLAAVAVSAIAASAQVYVGGTLGLVSEKAKGATKSMTTAGIIPELGYTFNKTWEAGVRMGYTSVEEVGTFAFAPYARYTAANYGPINLFVEGGVDFKKKDNIDASFGIGVRPGLSVDLNKNISFISKLGFLGYQDTPEGSVTGFNFSTENVNFGVVYRF